MKRWLDDWQTEADEPVTLAKFAAAFAVFVLWFLAIYVYVTVLTP